MVCKRIPINFRVFRKAQDKITELLSQSTHSEPILGVFWHGTQIEGKSMEWKWDVMTHEKCVLDSYDALEFEASGRRFFSVHENPDVAAEQLDGMMIAVISNRLAIVKQRFWRA